MPVSIRAALVALLVLAALGRPLSGLAQESLRVTMDLAEIVRIDRPADTIIIGNPGLLGATLADSRTLVLTGRATGTTNLIVLGQEGDRVAEYLVRISPPGRTLTTVYHGTERRTYQCAQTCTPVPAVGDEAGFFQEAQTQTQARQPQPPGAEAE